MSEGNGCINCGGDGCDACFDTMSGELFEDANLAENWLNVKISENTHL